MSNFTIREHHLPHGCYADRRMDWIAGIVVHYVSARWVDPDNRFDLGAIRRMLIDLNLPPAGRHCYNMSDLESRTYASYHYLIGRRGAVHELVPLPQVAYHAGESTMHDGVDGCNEFCIGIALAATHDSGFTSSQYEAFQWLSRQLTERYGIDRDWIQGHEDVATPAGRKQDPGPRFDWDRALAAIDKRTEA